jgi:spermidine/putrescine transport system ATP-binding protein
MELKLAPGSAPDAMSAAVVVRPEYLHFVTSENGADNVVRGTVYNEYSLGSRVQYQVRAGERTYLLEVPRAAAIGAGNGAEVMIGWDARDAIVVED